MSETISLQENVEKIVNALEMKGFDSIKEQRFTGSDYTQIYADFKKNHEVSVIMMAGGPGDNIAFGAKVIHGPGDFPKVNPAPIRGGKPESIINSILDLPFIKNVA